ncbi:MAG: hypothetical protein HY901_11980 [Deltaproteobacteria bacterium]|nr:hypothetical protein [Deltaproteobacteria bacterium]
MSELKMNREKLLDKLGERWLFEKRTVTLYDQILKKLEALEFEGDVSKLQQFRQQEYDHQRSLETYIKQCGSNIRKRTPSQRAVEIESQAFENIIADTDDPAQLLHVLLDAEMDDNASWELLIQLARRAGQTDFIDAFQEAMEHERQHLRTVRNLILRLARRELVEQVSMQEA